MNHLFATNNKKLLEKLIPKKNSLPEKETNSTVINWYFKINLTKKNNYD